MPQLNGRILALDYGKRRIGLAVSDPLGLTAQPLPTYTRRRIREDLAALARLARERDTVLLVVGDPLYPSGDPSPLAAEAHEFAAKLSAAAKLPVEFLDERLTSAQAHRLLDEEGLGREARKGKVDSIAATLLLETYLERLHLR